MLVNQTIKTSDGNKYRVLWISSEVDYLVVIRIDIITSVPEIYSYAEWCFDFENGDIHEIIDPFKRDIKKLALSQKQTEKRDNIWMLISEIVNKEPEIYTKSFRSACINKLVIKYNLNKKSLYNYLRLFWQKGKCKNALIPDYSNCGGRDKEKKETGCKRGRPNIYLDYSGCNIKDKDKKNIKKILKK